VPVVAHFWSVSWDLHSPFDAETLPHPTVHITFERERGKARAFVGGVSKQRFTKRLTGRGFVFGIKMRPAAFAALSDERASALTNRREPIARCFGKAGTAVAEAIATAESMAARIELAEAFLMERVHPLPTEASHIRDLVERMATDRALVRVADVAAASGLEVRTLERAFARYVGVSPKWVLRRYRLHEAAELLHSHAPPPLASLAASLGYADQAHFARDFRATIGQTPRAFIALSRIRA